MEVRVLNFPEHLNDRPLRQFLWPHLLNLKIRAVDFKKAYGKKTAALTFLHEQEGAEFLKYHGQAPRVEGGLKRFPVDRQRYVLLKFNEKPVYFEKSGYPPDPHTLGVLEREQKQRDLVSTKSFNHSKISKFESVSFTTSSVSCGTWDYDLTDLVFSRQLRWAVGGTAKFGPKSLLLHLSNGFRIDFRYSAVLEIVAETYPEPAFIISLRQAPRFYQKVPDDAVAQLMAQLNLQPNTATTPSKPRNGPSRIRLPALDSDHARIAGNCLVYRLELQKTVLINRHGDQENIGARIERMSKSHEIPTTMLRPIDVVVPSSSFAAIFNTMMEQISSFHYAFPFALKFQLHRLAQNNYLQPEKILQLLPNIHAMFLRNTQDVLVCVAAVRKLFGQISWAGPDTDAEEFSTDVIRGLLIDNELQVLKEGIPADMSPFRSNYNNVVNIYHVKITPSGMYLHGPEPETKNRVLRKYPDHHDSFVRVQFCDEDGEPIFFSPRVNSFKIYHERFKSVLDAGINIGGRSYHFLGFSHSSLRAQSCWFVAPFIFNGEVLTDRGIIEDLGDFTMIRSPAKCAARIGQVFSDTSVALPINERIVHHVEDVKCEDRIFSDGVGTISPSLLKKVWGKLPVKRRIKPTCLQIRYRGAKGMISLDSRLTGDVLVLRPSMVKFEGSTSNDLEICESAYRPLPMYLNRQLIKTLEDMGVSDKFFLDLQAEEVERLRAITDSPVNAATFLRSKEIGTAFHFPWLLNHLASLNIDYKQDAFLRDVLEVATLIELRQLKHKTRIPVHNGWHLHGIMDETGFLKEGEIFCSVVDDGVIQPIVGDGLIISRCPALHPGDVQLVNAVLPPPGSPLLDVFNCICFSQHGHRDLPSQLSGGDLDGDRYYLMFDENAKLSKGPHPPAAYPIKKPVELDRQVTREDMTKHFLDFMETDQLGRIAVAHRVSADQMVAGTLDPKCLQLAALHSDAVDFSKTGIAVNPNDIPRSGKYRPDFEAPGPHVHIKPLRGLVFEDAPLRELDEQEDEDDDFTSYRYYESPKILGKLYRAIDERKLFMEIQERARSADADHSTVIKAVWSFVQSSCALIQYGHLLDWAWGIREMYEGCLSNIMIDFSTHPSGSLSELEAFIGNILGQTSVPSKRQRDNATSMREKFEVDSLYIVNAILKDGDEWSKESLERSMACLAVSLEPSPTRVHRDGEHILSFKYVAAAVCLMEIEFLPFPDNNEVGDFWPEPFGLPGGDSAA